MTTQTIKRLFAVSGNRCAFPRCRTPILDQVTGVMLGEICHIKARSKGGTRYDPSQTDEERDAAENLILLCASHHKIVDEKPEEFTVEMLYGLKEKHEKKFRHGLEPSDIIAERLMLTLNISGPVTTSMNQQGGQTAHTIINYPPPPLEPRISLEPELEYHLSSIDNIAGIDYYDLNVSVHNDGEIAVRDLRVDVEIPAAHMETGTSYTAEVNSKHHTIRLFRHVWEKPHPIYSGDIEHIFKLLYSVNRSQYRAGASGSIKVTVFAADRLIKRLEKPIAEMLSDERVRFYQDSDTSMP